MNAQRAEVSYKAFGEVQMIRVIISDLYFAFSGISWIFSSLINFNGFLSIKRIEERVQFKWYFVIYESPSLPADVAAPQLSPTVQLSMHTCCSQIKTSDFHQPKIDVWDSVEAVALETYFVQSTVSAYEASYKEQDQFVFPLYYNNI